MCMTANCSTHSAAANSDTDICSSAVAGAAGAPGATGPIGFKTAARPTDLVGDTDSIIHKCISVI